MKVEAVYIIVDDVVENVVVEVDEVVKEVLIHNSFTH